MQQLKHMITIIQIILINQKIDNDHIANFAPRVVEGVNRLKKLSESI